jgi:hypothetical protein
LACYATARYPQVTSLPPDTVRALLGTRRRQHPRSGRESPDLRGAWESALHAGAAGTGQQPMRGAEPIDAHVAAETKLDRLLRSYVR